MKKLGLWGVLVFNALFAPAIQAAAPTSVPTIDRVLDSENRALGVEKSALPVVGDLAYLRRVSVDLIGRIPTDGEIQEYLSLPASTRREKTVDKLLQNPRFNDRWTVFFADMLRLRSNAEGGAALIAFVHQAISKHMPYDELAKRLISAGGKSGAVPEVGYILGDNADPMALAGVTSQVFMGVRISCAQCHDHPFDKWTQKDFYGFAAYFGKTRRQERRINNRTLGVYTTEVEQTTVLWPPEGAAGDAKRKPMPPVFPLTFSKTDGPYKHLARLEALRSKSKKQSEAVVKKDAGPSIDDLLADAAKKATKQTRGGKGDVLGVVEEAKRDVRGIDLKAAAYRNSQLRAKLADLVTDPRNHYFSRCFVNRVWADLVGRGIVNPVDDFSGTNPPSHPQTLTFLAHEFTAYGYDLRTLVKSIVTSQAYQRTQAYDRDEAERVALEANFLATPMRRMLSEVLYDSVITAGHLFEEKHEAGQNLKTMWQYSRVVKKMDDNRKVDLAAVQKKPQPAQVVMKNKPKSKIPSGYDLEKAIEFDFSALLKKQSETVQLDRMMVKSAEEIEAERMQQEARRQQADYVDVFVRRVVDDNPTFGTSMRMASPAPDGHFLRVFGQPNRNDLGDLRDPSPTMRQALMMLNGRLSHEASRVGALEPVHKYLVGKTADLSKAIQLVYREILTREASQQEVADAKSIINKAATPAAGMADLRWVLLNGHEFRFLP